MSFRLSEILRGRRKVYLDTSVFIYFIENHPRYYDLCDAVFKSLEDGRIEAATSTLTMLEVLVQPYRLKRDDLVLKFYALLTTYPHLTWIPMTLDISDRAAQLRAEYNLKTPDAIQLASAISSGAAVVICNDRGFRKITEIECLMIDDCI